MNSALPAHGEPPFPKIRHLMEEVFGFREFRPGQKEILEAIFSGEDALVVMPTGGGKSLCYQIPALVMPGLTLVISPLIALMKDQVDSLRVRELPAVSVNSLMSLSEQEKALRQISAGSYQIVYASPERLRNGAFLEALKNRALSLVAVDEAHCISEWGHDFRPDYLRIARVLERLGRPQTIALTATATAAVRQDIVKHLRLRAPRQFITGFDRKNLFWEVFHAQTPREKLSLLVERLAGLRGGGIVYTGTRKKVEEIVRHLNEQGIPARGYHAGMEEEERSRVQEDFLEGKQNLIVATNAFGMGIDRADIRLVVHHHLPGSIEAYYQESGRAGRDGEPAACLLLFSPADRRLQEFFIESSHPAREIILAVYSALLAEPQDFIWLTHREIGRECDPPVAEAAVASSLKILEAAGVVQRLHRYENRAELYLRRRPEEILRSQPKRSPGKAAFLRLILELHTEEEMQEGIQFLPEEMIARAGISPETFRRVMADLEGKGEGTYLPPFRGRGLRLLSRRPAEELPIDFERLRLRKAGQLEKLNQIMTYGAGGQCRRAFLLGYFGEHFSFSECGGCDFCLKEKKRALPAPEGDPLLGVKILSGVARLQGRFGQTMAVKMLAGSRDGKIIQFRLDRLSTYGLLADHTQEQIEKWIHELMARGLIGQQLRVQGEKTYPVLLLTPRGREAMRHREPIPLAPFPSAAKPPSAGEGEEFRPDLFDELRRLRSQLARRENLPPYCIFHDRTLREMARALPHTPQRMKAIVGVGEITFQKYGRDFLELISSYKSAGRNRESQR